MKQFDESETFTVLPNFGGKIFRILLIILTAYFLFLMVLGEWKSGLAYHLAPNPFLFFTQIAGLFPDAKKADIDFRLEGWVCEDGIFKEIDTAPYFPIQAGNKENRFQRAVYFYSHNKLVMNALEFYVMNHYNGEGKNFDPSKRNQDSKPIGGIRILSTITPIPSPEEGVSHYKRKPLTDFPIDQTKKLYETPSRIISNNCRIGQ